MKHHPNAQHQRGFTLIEAGIVLAVVAIVAAGAAPSMQSVIDARRLEGTAAQLAGDIRWARSEAIARNAALRLRLQPAANGGCYVIHTSATDECSCLAAGPAQCSGEAQAIKTVALTRADRVSLQSNVASMRFDPLHGTSTPTGTLRVVGANERAIHHVVNIMGRVRSCSPQAAVRGYAAC
jgi:type IV fimbrial biogenesis protein FimT